MLSDVIGMHALDSVETIVLTKKFINILLGYLTYLYTMLAKPNNAVLHIKCNNRHTLRIFPDFCHLPVFLPKFDTMVKTKKHANL